MPVDADVCLKELAAKTELFTGADLENLCKEVQVCQVHVNANRRLTGVLRGLCCIFQAALLALDEENLEASSIRHSHFLRCLIRTSPSLTAQQLKACLSLPT